MNVQPNQVERHVWTHWKSYFCNLVCDNSKPFRSHKKSYENHKNNNLSKVQSIGLLAKFIVNMFANVFHFTALSDAKLW